jgi:hypothetical protein
MMSKLQRVGIDLNTDGASEFIRMLGRRKDIFQVEGPFPYREDKSYSQVYVTSGYDLDSLDKLLENFKYADCVIGFFQEDTNEE